MLCEYRHIFGEEGKGVHSIRIANIAVVDLGLTLLAGLFISKWLRINLYLTWAILILLGIFFHRLFCVNTTINKAIFGTV
jgi:fatty-acid desaturase